MKIPEISEEFKERFLNGPRCTAAELERSAGMALFTEDEVLATSHELDILLRSVFVRKRISKEHFAQQCRRYAIEVMGLMSAQANTPGSNLMRALKMGNITIQRFNEALQVLNFTISEATVTLADTDGKQETFSVRDAYERYTHTDV